MTTITWRKCAVMIVFLILACGTFAPCSLAESEVFSSMGVHRKIALYVDSTHRFVLGKKPSEQAGKLRDAVTAKKAVGGLDYAKALSELACFLIDREHYDEAEPLCTEALEIRKKELSKADPDLAAAMHNLGALYDLRHKLGDDAAEYYISSLKTVSDYGPSEFRAYITQNLGEFEYAKNKLELAEGMFRYSLKDLDALSSKPSLAVYEVLDSLTRCMEEEGHSEEARPFIERSNKMAKWAFEETTRQMKKEAKESGGTVVFGSGGPRKKEKSQEK